MAMLDIFVEPTHSLNSYRMNVNRSQKFGSAKTDKILDNDRSKIDTKFLVAQHNIALETKK